MTDTVRTLLQQDDENDLYRILTKDQGYIIRCVGDALMNDDPAFLDLPAQWHLGWMWILEGFEAPEDKWRLLSDEDRDAVWARADAEGKLLPDEMEQVYQTWLLHRDADARVLASEKLFPHRDILIAYDWPEGDEHLRWVGTADEEEILQWCESIKEESS